MKNYFYGVNANVRTYFNNVNEKSVLFGNNYNHVKNVQSITSTQNIYFNAIDPSLSAQARANAVNSRFNDLQSITKNNPNIKLDPATFNAIAKGEEVNLKLELDAPERRNLFVGLAVAAAQLAGGIGGAAYSQQLGEFAIGRAQGDAEYIAKHGNSYKLNFFGGAEVQTGRITVGALPQKEANEQREFDRVRAEARYAKAAEVKIATRPIGIGNDPREVEVGTVRAALAYRGKLGVGNQRQNIQSESINVENSYNVEAKKQYGIKNVQNGEDNGGRKGTVSAIAVTSPSLLKSAAAKIATADYLRVTSADSSTLGLIQDAKLRASLVTKQDVSANSGSAVGTFNLLKKEEQGLLSFTGNKADQLLGGQHTVNSQKVANDYIKVFTDSNQNISQAIKGKAAITDQTTALYLRANKLDGGVALSPEKLKVETAKLNERVKNGDLTGLAETIAFNSGQASAKAKDITGIYAKNNKIVGETLAALPKLEAQGKALIDLIKERQAGSGKTFSSGSGEKTTLSDAATGLKGAFSDGSTSAEDQKKALDVFGGALAQQLAANGIRKSDNTAFTADEAVDLSKKIASGSTEGIDAGILGNQALTANLKSVGELANGAKTRASQTLTEQKPEESIKAVTAANIKNFSGNLASQLIQEGVKENYSYDDIKAVALAVASGDKSKLTTESQKKLIDEVAKSTTLNSSFKSFGNFVNASDAATASPTEELVAKANTAADNFAQVFNKSQDTLAVQANAQNVGSAKKAASGGGKAGATDDANKPRPQITGLLDENPAGLYADASVQRAKNAILTGLDINSLKDKIKSGEDPFEGDKVAQEIFRQTSGKRELNDSQKTLKSISIAVSGLADEAAKTLFGIADKILDKAFRDFEYNYGFNDQASNEAHGGSVLHSSAGETYNLGKVVAAGTRAGLDKIDQAQDARKAEALSSSKSLRDGIKAFNEKSKEEIPLLEKVEADKVAALKAEADAKKQAEQQQQPAQPFTQVSGALAVAP